MELIKIQQLNGRRIVSARDLHEFLGVKTDFTDWVKRMMAYGFEKDVDYWPLILENPTVHNKKNYAFTLNCAMQVSMFHRTNKGKQAGKYLNNVIKTNRMELIEIKQVNGSQAVSARDLHEFLGVKGDFAHWIKRMMAYGFEKDVDYSLVENDERTVHNKKEYVLTLECAKEIAMIQRTDKGKQARKYFIECERRANNSLMNMSEIDRAKLYVASLEKSEQLKEDLKASKEDLKASKEVIKLQEEQLKKQAPEVEYTCNVLKSHSTYTTSQIAKELNLSAVALNKELKSRRIQYKQNGTWLLYSKYVDKGYVKTNTYSFSCSSGSSVTSMQTVWTEKGRRFIHSILNNSIN